ncbi:MAG TPA: GGDEF domain-containing protein [Gemmatimonadaceae bacterium]|nr:GGDEF domain-containing protein [Gemmatimonadaceae bacterium]
MPTERTTSGRGARIVTVEEATAEALVWQSRVRLGAALFAALLVIARFVGDHEAVAAERALAALAVYAGVVWLSARLIRPDGAPQWAVWALTALDVATILVVTGLSALPPDYPQALLAGFGAMVFAEFTHGRRVALGVIWGVVAGYLLLIRGVTGAPTHALEWAPQLVSLALFTATSVAFISLYGSYKERLEMIVELFRRAEEGEFDREYPIGAGSPADAVTMVGRAYNRVRSQLANLVLTDPLSGCLNRRGLEQNLTREIARAVRTGKEIALLAMDIDHFKAVNDTLGHLAGDAVIQEVGEVLREIKRGGDVLARIGGDEFALLLPETGAAGAFRVATRIRDEVRAHKFHAVGSRVPVTVSIGLVSDRVTDENVAHDLHSRADEALYAAKESGRDRVMIWNANMRAFVLTHTAETPAPARPSAGFPPRTE